MRYSVAPQQEEEGDSNYRRLLCGAMLQLHNRKKKATAVAIAFFVELRCSCTAGGRGRRRLFRGVALQLSSTAGRRQLPSPSSWSCTAVQLHNRKKKLPSPFSVAL